MTIDDQDQIQHVTTKDGNTEVRVLINDVDQSNVIIVGFDRQDTEHNLQEEETDDREDETHKCWKKSCDKDAVQTCDVCGVKVNNFWKHKESVHKIFRSFQCPHCDTQYCSQVDLERHLSTIEKKNEVKRFNKENKQTAVQSINNVKAEEFLKKVQSQVYPCNECGFKTHSKTQYIHHVLNTCEMDPSNSYRLPKYKKHMIIQHGKEREHIMIEQDCNIGDLVKERTGQTYHLHQTNKSKQDIRNNETGIKLRKKLLEQGLVRRKSHKLQDSATRDDSSEEVDNVDEINETDVILDFTQDNPDSSEKLKDEENHDKQIENTQSSSSHLAFQVQTGSHSVQTKSSNQLFKKMAPNQGTQQMAPNQGTQQMAPNQLTKMDENNQLLDLGHVVGDHLIQIVQDDGKVNEA